MNQFGGRREHGHGREPFPDEFRRTYPPSRCCMDDMCAPTTTPHLHTSHPVQTTEITLTIHATVTAARVGWTSTARLATTTPSVGPTRE